MEEQEEGTLCQLRQARKKKEHAKTFKGCRQSEREKTFSANFIAATLQPNGGRSSFAYFCFEKRVHFLSVSAIVEGIEKFWGKNITLVP